MKPHLPEMTEGSIGYNLGCILARDVIEDYTTIVNGGWRREHVCSPILMTDVGRYSLDLVRFNNWFSTVFEI